MALHGTFVEIKPDQFGFESTHTLYNEPKRVRQVWALSAVRTSGYSYCRIQDAIGKPATCTDARVNCYLGQGNSVAAVIDGGGSAKAIIHEILPVPRPKCRVETRWYDGQWQKLTRKGWIPA
jgi:hypothetical protein